MADFFGNDDKGEETPSKITISGQEYDLNEIQTLIDTGKKAREAEEKYNTKLDRVWPEYGKTKQQLKELEEKLAEYEKKTAEQTPQDNGPLTEDVKRKAIEEARQLGLATKEDIEAAVVQILDRDFRPRFMVEREGEKLYERAIQLQSEIKGDDGRPKFDAQEIIEYMQESGIRDPQAAYKVKYEKELEEWGKQRFESRKPRDFFTEDSSNAGRSRTPQEPKVTEENIDDLVSQALYGDGETQ